MTLHLTFQINRNRFYSISYESQKWILHCDLFYNRSDASNRLYFKELNHLKKALILQLERYSECEMDVTLMTRSRDSKSQGSKVLLVYNNFNAIKDEPTRAMIRDKLRSSCTESQKKILLNELLSDQRNEKLDRALLLFQGIEKVCYDF